MPFIAVGDERGESSSQKRLMAQYDVIILTMYPTISTVNICMGKQVLRIKGVARVAFVAVYSDAILPNSY